MIEHPHRRHTAQVVDGKVVFTTFKTWHVGRGYRSWATEEEALAYAERTGDVARIDQIVSTIIWQKGDPL